MLRGKLIAVTGVASGIGAETARLLKQRGATVVGLDQRSTADNVDEFIQVDLQDPASIDAAVGKLPAGLIGLCNIAGVPPTAPEPVVLKVNCLGLKRLTLGGIDKMLPGASIVNVASLAGIGWRRSIEVIKAFEKIDFDQVEEFCGRHAIKGARSYFFSKEFLIVWTFENRWTWRDRGIRMNCVSPGPVQTPILPDFLKTLGDRAEEDARLMERPGRPEDIAPVIAFMQSDDSAWFQGANLSVDGGMSAHVELAESEFSGA